MYLSVGSAFSVPFKDESFDLVFVSGLLVIIPPSHVEHVLREIYRCSKRYIWEYEYYADDFTEIEYRGHRGVLWKADFAKLFLDTFPDLRLIKEKKYKHLDSDNVDSMFLLTK
jgi:ubiquinone/menaquinone biosynthesis C-methylase UbiE